MNNLPPLLELYQYMYAARRVDVVEQSLVARGDAFFHVSGAGHEATAALASSMIADDYLLPHYRAKALMLARGMTPEDFFHGSLCSGESASRGRQMCAHVSAPQVNIVSMCGPVGNNSLHAVGMAIAVADRPTRPIVVCGCGEGSTQEGEFLEAVAEASRQQCPVMFLIEDNGWAISTTTAGKTFYSPEMGAPQTFHGVSITHLDGSDPAACHTAFQDLVAGMRADRKPRIVVMHVERLTNHTNADDQRQYREPSDIERARREGDPLTRLEKTLAEHSVTLEGLRQEVDRQIAAAERRALCSADPPLPELGVDLTKAPIPIELTHPAHERRGDADSATLTMKDAMRLVLKERLTADPRVTLWGQDIEDPKGDVFGVTRGLSTEFPGRVANAPLSESTIIGVSIGRALTGERPVAFIQFADFLPLAHNQIVNELATMYWRSAGQWTAPVIVMAPCGGYRPGLGPYHSQSGESVYVHAYGVDVMMPATAGDAAGMLNAAFASQRPTMFFYPKALLNDMSVATSSDVTRQLTPIGVARKARSGSDITLVGWGNTVKLCEKAADALQTADVDAEVLDLRCLSPWDRKAVLASAERTSRLVVVQEDSSACGVAAEVLAHVAENARVPVAMRRVTREQGLLPCHFESQLATLPTFRRTLEAACELLKLEVQWVLPQADEPGVAAIEAIGSGPSDETVTVVSLNVKVGDRVTQGDVVASLEATKSVFDLSSSIEGEVLEILAADGDTLTVGSPLVKLRTDARQLRKKPVVQEQSGRPVLTKMKPVNTIVLPSRKVVRRELMVGLAEVATVVGDREVFNSELQLGQPTMTSEEIIRRTGIESRRWIGQGQDAVSMAAEASWRVLDRHNLTPDDLDLLICSTTSPSTVTPSMACRVLSAMAKGKHGSIVQAYDINAACSGYLYALQSAFDYLQSDPDGRVLLVTTEVLSPLLDPADSDTAILFGDAATATLLCGETHYDRSLLRLQRPELSAKPEDGSVLSVPLANDGFIKMQGRRVFSEAVRLMVASLNRACEHRGLAVDDLSLVVPHQANQRIIDAVQHRVAAPVYSNIRHFGNTSSSSIPLCLHEVMQSHTDAAAIGLCAFGGGFTFGAGILERS